MKSYNLSFAMNRAARSTLAIALAVAGCSVYAADADSNLAVSANIANACSITTTPVAFGDYDSVAKTEINTTGSITVTCTNGASTFVKLGQGLHAGGASTNAVPVRQMASGGNFLPYSLSTLDTQAVVWEMTTGVAHAGTGIATVMTVYGRIAAGQNVPAGAYADTVVARVTF
jgi:spore coat protein U-like protein